MQVVDGVEVHVLRVPRERGLPHTKVQVRRGHAFHLHTQATNDDNRLSNL